MTMIYSGSLFLFLWVSFSCFWSLICCDIIAPSSVSLHSNPCRIHSCIRFLPIHHLHFFHSRTNLHFSPLAHADSYHCSFLHAFLILHPLPSADSMATKTPTRLFLSLPSSSSSLPVGDAARFFLIPRLYPFISPGLFPPTFPTLRAPTYIPIYLPTPFLFEWT